MGKRKGNALQNVASTSGTKRLRENGRLKMQNADDFEYDEDMQDKILKEAGVDDETMKSIPDTEKQAIIKAILESNQQLKRDVVVVESSESSDSKDSASVVLSMVEEETQPPNGFDECSNTSMTSNDDDAQKDNAPLQTVHEDRSENEDESNSSCRSSPVVSLLDEVMQPYQLDEEVPSVLVTETQFSPHRTTKMKSDVHDVIPESPSPASSDAAEEKEQEAGENDVAEIQEGESVVEPCEDAVGGLLNRIYPIRSTTTTVQDFPPRFIPGIIRNQALYSKVIKSLLDMYIRRLRAAQSCSKQEPTKWGDSVKTGLHWENLLRRRTLGSDNKDDKTGRGRRGRRRILKNENNDTDSPSVSTYKGTIRERSKPQLEGDLTSDVTVDDNKDECEKSISCCIELDQESPEEIRGSKRKNISIFEMATTGFNLRSNAKRKVDAITFASTIDHLDNDDVFDLSSGFNRNSSSAMACKQEIELPQEPDIQILDADSSSESKDSSGAWLSVKNNDSRKKNITNNLATKQRREKIRPNSPQVLTSLLKRREMNRDDCQSKDFKDVPPERDLSRIIEDAVEKQVFKKKLKIVLNETDDVSLNPLKERHVTSDDLPSSIDSAHLLNTQGDMYSTQMTKIKIASKKRLGTIGNALDHHTPSTSSSVAMTCQRRRTRKRLSPSADDIEIIEQDSEKESELCEKITARKSNKKRSLDKKDKEKKKNDLSVLDNPEIYAGDNCSDYESRLLLNRSVKSVKADTILNYDESFAQDDERMSRRNKRKLFDADSYIFVEESKTKHSSDDETGIDHEDRLTLNQANKGPKSDTIFKLDESHAQDHGSIRKSRRNRQKLFVEGNYYLVEESKPMHSSVDIKKRSEGEHNETEVETDEINVGSSSLDKELHHLSSNNEDRIEKITEGTCPICDQVFHIDELGGHASTCGEGATDNEIPAVVKCMICDKEIPSEVLKEHQTRCATTIQVLEEEERPTRRITRLKKSNPQRTRALLRDKSPSSNGEDYGDLIVEVDKEKKSGWQERT